MALAFVQTVSLTPADPLATHWLVVATAVFWVASVSFVAFALVDAVPGVRRCGLLLGIVSVTTALAYLTTALGIGRFAVVGPAVGAGDLPWVRYGHWLVTTPTLLAILGRLVGLDARTLFSAVAVNWFAIATGILGLTTSMRPYRYVWWAVAGLALISLITFFLVTLGRYRPVDGSPIAARRVRVVYAVVWMAYPLWSLFGGGWPTLSPTANAVGFFFIDLFATVGVGITVLASIERGAPDRTDDPTTGPAVR